MQWGQSVHLLEPLDAKQSITIWNTEQLLDLNATLLAVSTFIHYKEFMLV